MTKIGYARISSKSQNLQRQIKNLKANEVDKIYQDTISGATSSRPALKEMLNYIREAELDRLGRNNQDLTKIMSTIQSKGATLEVLNLPSMKGIKDKNLRQLINNLILEIYKYKAESERKDIIERQKEGIALAKKEGKYKGRKPLYDNNSPQLNHAFSLYKEGESITQTAKKTGINRETLRRYIKQYIVQQN